MSACRYRELAWLCLAVALPLRLWFFAGFGLGDDPNESFSLMWFAERLRLNPDDFLHYRVVNIVIRGLCYRWFGIGELPFILPVLAAALATHAAGLLLADELMGARAAFLTSLLFLVTPYETLASTANAPDYFHAFFGTAAAWGVARGVRRDRARPMALAAVSVALGFMSRVSTLLLLPVLALACVLSAARWRRWLVFWGTFAALLALGCVADWLWSGSPVRWFVFNSAGGLDMTGIVGITLRVYPRYLFLFDDFGHPMFALSGWLAAAGTLLAAVRLVHGRAGVAEAAVLLGFIVFGGLVEFLPHRATVTAYWSHPRIFRYLAQLAPALYVCGAYLLDRAWTWRPAVGTALVALVALAGLAATPAVAEPLRDANRDSRALLAFLQRHEVWPGDPPMTLHTDDWRVAQIWSRYPGVARAWRLVGVPPDSDQRKVAFLAGVTDGLIVTGGASLPWYSGPGLIVSLKPLPFAVPPSWHLVWELPGAETPWRLEPLRVWLVQPASGADARPAGSLY